MSEEKTAIKLLKPKHVLKMEKVELYFHGVKNSPVIAGFETSLTELEKKINTAGMQELEGLKKAAAAIEKEIESERAIINEPLNKIKELNQDIFAPLKKIAGNLKKLSGDKYLRLYRAEEARRALVQAELDKKRAEEQAKLEAEFEKKRIESKEKEIAFIPPPEIPDVKVAPTELSRRTIPKSIVVTIADKKEFVKHIVKTDNNAFWAMVEIGSTKTLQDMAKANPGETEIPGVAFDYIPNLKTHQNKN